MNGIFLLLGSNQGNRLNHINYALELISDNIGKVGSMSSLYRSSSWGDENQPDFLNMVIKVESTLSASEIMRKILTIENMMGRIRTKKWASRIIDIDILYYENSVIDEADLHIPHPRIQDRRFTLIPLVEIAPDEIHPVRGVSNSELLRLSTDPGRVEKI